MVVTYPAGKGAADPVDLTVGDLKRLAPLEFLNDNLVDFYFKVVDVVLVAEGGMRQHSSFHGIFPARHS